ncbi:MAG: TonB-dependent receptor plug domain-containing protein, partial [Candidatus Muiribacteriaceae bacterium]
MKKTLVYTLLALTIITTWGDDTFRMDEFVITGTKTEHLLEEAPVHTEVITEETLKKKGITDIKDAFDEVAGVKAIRSMGSWGNKGNISIQGMSSEHILILVDGMQITGGHGGTDISSIPVNSIERIEIVKGSASALYGSEAIGGVINIITNNAEKKNSLSLEMGKYNTEMLKFSTGDRDGEFGYSINYAREESDGINPDYVSGGERQSDWYKESSLSAKLLFGSGRNTLAIDPSWSEQTMRDGLTATTWQDRIQKRTGMNLTYNSVIDSDSAFKVNYSDYEYEHYTEDRTSEWTDNNQNIDIMYNTTSIKGNNIILGSVSRSEERDDKGKGFKKERDIDSFYIQDEITSGSNTFVLGLRSDDYEDLGKQDNPRIAVHFRKDRDVSYRLSYGEAFRAPDLNKMYAVPWIMGPYNVISNPSLKPEESTNYMLGIDVKRNENSKLYVNLFKNELENLINYTTTRVGPPPWNMNWVNVD